MKESIRQPKLATAAVTDRGLSEKRPLNEDSFLADAQRRVFAVADGVGGAQAGEVASQTAIEVLDEAFRHHEEGVDIEDLMEIAIQRANTSIYRMAKEHAKFSMMATTIVALHLEGEIATIGHVGDSRLYRMAPNGTLHRETADHSVVEEEVRAGRMTPDQAATHPNRNVISRALGVEETVEVDLKTIEVQDGTSFLLCSDGITRHIPDIEIGQLLSGYEEPGVVCDELKKRCYQRGAEDNLTAILVRVNVPQNKGFDDEDEERTIFVERPPRDPARASDALSDGKTASAATAEVESKTNSRPAGAEAALRSEQSTGINHVAGNEQIAASHDDGKSPSGTRVHSRRAVGALLILLLLGLVGAAAFYGGTLFEKRKIVSAVANRPVAVVPSASPESLILPFERDRTAIDHDPGDWLSRTVAGEIGRQGISDPIDSSDPNFLYLYGRACLLSGDYEKATRAFEQAISKSEQNRSTASPVRVEARLGLAAASLKLDRQRERLRAYNALDDVVRKSNVTVRP